MEEKLRGIVVSNVNYGESDKILGIFTLEKGIVSAKIKGVKKAGAKMKFASEPFCFAEFVFSERAGKRTVIGASLIDSFYPIREDVERFFAGGTVLEYTKKFLYEGIKNQEYFLLLIETLKSLAYGDQRATEITASFLLKALNLSGYGITTSNCSLCEEEIEGRVFFDYSTGGFYCLECKNDTMREISHVTLQGVGKLLEEQPLTEEESIKTLKLFDYYLLNKAEVKLKSLAELINISAL